MHKHARNYIGLGLYKQEGVHTVCINTLLFNVDYLSHIHTLVRAVAGRQGAGP